MICVLDDVVWKRPKSLFSKVESQEVKPKYISNVSNFKMKK